MLLAGCGLVHGLALHAPQLTLRRHRTDCRMKLSDDGVLGVGVIGAGRIGLVHLEALSSCESAKAVIISNPTVSKAEAAALKYKLEHFTRDFNEVIHHPDVEAVWICSPSQFHAEQIKACAAAGKHIFCEKPIATDLKETVEAINACNKAGVKLMTALQRRFDPNFQRVKQAIVGGEVGEIVQVKLCSRDPAPPPFEYVKGGGGLFKDMAVHDLDMARFLMGSEPVEILAKGSCQIDPSIKVLPGPEAFDTATVLMQFANGKDAMIDVCRQAPYGYDQRAEVRGQECTQCHVALSTRVARAHAPHCCVCTVWGVQERGADISFLSAFPGEREYLFPPLTYLQPTGKTAMTLNGVAYVVLQVEPRT